MLRWLYLAMSAIFLSGSVSHAEISQQTIAAYNEAISNADPAQIEQAAKQLAEAAMSEPNHPDAALMAFEAAWSLCQIEQCEAGREAAAFAAAQPANGYPSEPIRQVLISYIDWTGKDTRKTRRTLDAALLELQADDVTTLSITVFQSKIFADLRDTRWENAATLSKAAIDHFETVANEIPSRLNMMRLLSVTSAFNADPDYTHLALMAELEAQFDLERVRAEQISESGTAPTWMDDLYWRAYAWRLAIEAFVRTVEPSKLRRVDVQEIQAPYAREIESLRQSIEDVPIETDERAPFCENGQFNMRPPIRYPRSAAFKGRFGAVIASVSVRNGKPSDVQILSAVPLEGFASAVEETVRKWVWEPADGTDLSNCDLHRDNIIMPFVFSIEG
ncbi:MAG: energy transducer TonB [Pseudomonadota bacterium]